MLIRFFVIVFLSSIAFSQEERMNTSTKKNQVCIAYSGGISFSDFQSKSEASSFYSNYYGVMENDIQVQYLHFFGEKIGISGGVNFRAFSYKSPNYNSLLNDNQYYYKTRLNYLGIPLLVHFQIGEKFRISTGFSGEYYLRGREKQIFVKGESENGYIGEMEHVEKVQIVYRLKGTYPIWVNEKTSIRVGPTFHYGVLDVFQQEYSFGMHQYAAGISLQVHFSCERAERKQKVKKQSD